MTASSPSRPTSHLLRWISLSLVMVGIVGAILLVICRDAFPGTLRFDSRTGPYGTGEAEYRYKSGALSLKEQYWRGKIQRSDWFKPDGSHIMTTVWVNGCGEGIYVREDGSIKTRMTYKNMLADGPATYYAPDGSVLGEAVFKDGSRVSGYDPAKSPEKKD